MRPSRLDPFFASARSLPGVGPKIGALIARAVGAEGDDALVRDLLFHLPSGIVDRRHRPPLYQMPPSGPVTVEATVERIERPRSFEGPWRIVLADGNATIQVVYFKAEKDWLTKLYPIGARLVVSGEVEWFDMRPQIRHPDYVLPPERASEMPASRTRLPPDVRPLSKGPPPRDGRGARPRARNSRSGFRLTFFRHAAGPPSARRSGSHTTLRRWKGPARQGRLGSGSPSTSSSPASSRSRLSAAA